MKFSFYRADSETFVSGHKQQVHPRSDAPTIVHQNPKIKPPIQNSRSSPDWNRIQIRIQAANGNCISRYAASSHRPEDPPHPLPRRQSPFAGRSHPAPVPHPPPSPFRLTHRSAEDHPASHTPYACAPDAPDDSPHPPLHRRSPPPAPDPNPPAPARSHPPHPRSKTTAGRPHCPPLSGPTCPGSLPNSSARASSSPRGLFNIRSSSFDRSGLIVLS